MRAAFLPPTLLVLVSLGDARATTPIDLSTVRLVDLTHAYDNSTIYWPTSPSAFELKELFKGQTEGGYFYSANSFCTPEHGGTHLDAPVHFAEGAWAVDEIPLGKLSGPAVVLDISAKAANDPDYRLAVADIEVWEQAHGAIPASAIVLLETGWAERWPDRKRYLGDDTPGAADNLHFPSYGEAAARLLVGERKVAAIGVDTASIDFGQSKDFIVHRIAGAANVAGLENLTNLDNVPASGAWILALPMKIAGGSGAPVRVVALVPR